MGLNGRRRVAGIDLGGRSTGKTATAIAEGTDAGRPTITLLRHDADGLPLPKQPSVRRLATAVTERGAELVAIDAPLTLPHPVACEDPDCAACFPTDGTDADYTSRAADRAVSWRLTAFASHPMPVAMLGALTLRGVYLRRVLERSGVTVVETWPRGVYLSLRPGQLDDLPDSSREPATYVAMMLECLARHVDIADDVVDPDEVDAVAAACAAWAHVTSTEATHVGDADGDICVCTARWAQDPNVSSG